jgi:hypothetical protein
MSGPGVVGNPNWKPGVSGNPKGRPRGSGASTDSRRTIDQVEEVFVTMAEFVAETSPDNGPDTRLGINALSKLYVWLYYN